MPSLPQLGLQVPLARSSPFLLVFLPKPVSRLSAKMMACADGLGKGANTHGSVSSKPHGRVPQFMRLVVIGPYPVDRRQIGNGVEAVVVYLLQGLLSLESIEIDVISHRTDVLRPSTTEADRLRVHYLSGNQTSRQPQLRHSREALGLFADPEDPA